MVGWKEWKEEGNDSGVFYVTLTIPDLGLEDKNRSIAKLWAEVRGQVIVSKKQVCLQQDREVYSFIYRSTFDILYCKGSLKGYNFNSSTIMLQPKETHWNSSSCFYLVKITDEYFNFACEIFKVVFSKCCVTYLS
jgi:hypothetical protein